jgi:Tfp pilus assembly protein PilO
MKIKVLLVPTIIIFSGFLSINYLKPDFDSYMQKRIERADAKVHSEEVEMTVQNAMNQKNELDQNKDKAAFLNRFVPQEKDEARSLDNFNFLITQSGLVTSRIAIEGVVDQSATDSVFAVTEQISADPLVGMPGAAGVELVPAPIQLTYVAPQKEEYTVTLEGVGGYQNIKELITKVTSFDRLNALQSFKVTTTKNGTDAEPQETTGTLTVSVGLLLPYQKTPKLALGEAITVIPFLQQPSLDLSVVDSLQTQMTNTVPNSILGTDGKTNPFE